MADIYEERVTEGIAGGSVTISLRERRTVGNLLEPDTADYFDSSSSATGSGLVADKMRAGAKRPPSPRRNLHCPGSIQILKACVRDLEAALDEFDESVMARTNTLNGFRDSLGALWNLRDRRETEFAQFVNMLQCIFMGLEPEVVPREYLTATLEVLKDASTRRKIYPEQIANYTGLLTKAGIDVFRAIR